MSFPVLYHQNILGIPRALLSVQEPLGMLSASACVYSFLSTVLLLSTMNLYLAHIMDQALVLGV